MMGLSNQLSVRQEQGFEVYTLRNEAVEVTVVPELGARIISLKNLRTGREWMWHPLGGRRLFRNQIGDDFSTGPLVGWDECLPTIAPCHWRGLELPDHGEVWAVPWAVDPEAWEDGVLRMSVRLEISPFDFERQIELQDHEIHLSYRLRNRSAGSEPFLWAMHPLLRLQPGDELELAATTRALLPGAAWLDDPVAATLPGDCAKIFAAPLTEGLAAIQNRATGDRLEFEWSPAENHVLGIWLTQGGWHGHRHFALEPTNSAADSLAQAAPDRCGTVRPFDSVGWQVRLRLGKEQ